MFIPDSRVEYIIALPVQLLSSSQHTLPLRDALISLNSGPSKYQLNML
jgi:hypothetical protein